ncbi:MAG: hypothetical protein GY906_30180 [bacterium]|nr:hypothetical protein [bacterium]
MIRLNLGDPVSGRNVRVSENQALLVSNDGLPPPVAAGANRPIPVLRYYVQAETEDQIDMRVDGSVTPVTFHVSAHQDYDTYLHAMSTVIADAGASLSEFGNIGVLANGIEFYWERAGRPIEALAFRLFTNFDFVRLAAGDPAFGTGNASFKASNVEGTSEAFLPVMDFEKSFGMPHGILLRAGTNERLTLVINDDLTGVDGFESYCTGFRLEKI